MMPWEDMESQEGADENRKAQAPNRHQEYWTSIMYRYKNTNKQNKDTDKQDIVIVYGVYPVGSHLSVLKM